MNYKIVQRDFWQDEKIMSMTTEERYLYLYLLTNPYSSNIGIYKITKEQIKEHTGYEIDKVCNMINSLISNYKVIAYNEDTKEIAIEKWGKYNLIKGGKVMEESMKKQLSLVVDKSLVTYVALNIRKKWALDLYTQYCDKELTYYDIKELQFRRSNETDSYKN
ncbi:hypothetical protein CFOLD11_40890 [Clostridium folliculivorans]|uniref:DNA replication protein DnaD n=1 Tax=Clostridium folliculivorans TaxID=2886038 RepID=A0A9W5Y628_9CLOT|nr:hypothetical protein [Clostridium folliculivorans]GKU27262.1 hypothetical protein CFOLD11_40890 [Clostridium folliculivorans]